MFHFYDINKIVCCLKTQSFLEKTLSIRVFDYLSISDCTENDITTENAKEWIDCSLQQSMPILFDSFQV